MSEALTPVQIAKMLRNPMFSKRATLDEAFDYFFMVYKAANPTDRAAMTTATGVLLNTVAALLEPNNV